MKLHRINNKPQKFTGFGVLVIILLGLNFSCAQKQNVQPNNFQPTSIPPQLILPTRTVTPTFTSSPTSTGLSTPTPIYIYGNVLFEDDFEDNSLSKWRIPVGTPVWGIEQESDSNKVLVGIGHRGEEFSISKLNGNWTNYSLEFNIKITEITSDFRFEIAFRIEEPCNDYVTGLTAGLGWFLVTEKGCGTYSQIAGGIPGHEIFNRWASVRIEVFHSQIATYVNGSLIQKVEDTDHSRGGISFSVISKGKVEIDNVNVFELVSH